jgi:hypothetical protein
MSFGDFFLRYPENFPSQQVGQPWGEERVNIALAGSVFQFSGLSVRQSEFIRQRYADFLAPETCDHPPVVINVFRADPGQFRPIEIEPWVYTMDLDYQPAYVRIAGLNFMAIIDWNPELRAALWSAMEDGQDFGLVFENVFRIVAAYAVLRCNGVLLHSAGVSDGVRAWIGFGHSGAGKSTLSGLSLAAGKRVLSDDINVVRIQEAGWYAQRIPFAGELGPTYGDGDSYPLAGICRLYQGQEHELKPLGRAQGVALLVASSPYVNNDPYRVQDLMITLEALLDAVPCHRLTFRKDSEFWRLLNAMPFVDASAHTLISKSGDGT